MPRADCEWYPRREWVTSSFYPMTDTTPSPNGSPADLLLVNGRIATQDDRQPFVNALAIKDGRIHATGDAAAVMAYRSAKTRVVELNGRTVIPGLIDSHSHPIRGGLSYNLELRWDGVPSLADAMRMLREQARRTPVNHWVRVIGGWSEFQFAEKRMPTLEELNAAAPDPPLFVLRLYSSAMLNRAAWRAVGYTRDTPDPPAGEIRRDRAGNPTGLLIARPNAFILYSTLAKGPKLPYEQQLNSTRQFMRELNRLGVTSVIDAGGGFQNYPQDYQVVTELHKNDQLSVRLAANLFTQRPKQELEDFSNWAKTVKPGQGDDLYRINGAGEMLVYSAADFEDFLEPRPDMPANMEADLAAVVKLLAQNRWPVGAGTDATRVASYNPFVSLYWLISGKTVGGTRMYTGANRFERMEALRLWTVGSSWFSSDDGKKGALAPGQLADCAVLSADYFSIPEEEIRGLESVLTLVSGKPVYAAAEFKDLSPPPLPVSPEWSPVAAYGGFGAAPVPKTRASAPTAERPRRSPGVGGRGLPHRLRGRRPRGGFRSRPDVCA